MAAKIRKKLKNKNELLYFFCGADKKSQISNLKSQISNLFHDFCIKNRCNVIMLHRLLFVTGITLSFAHLITTFLPLRMTTPL